MMLIFYILAICLAVNSSHLTLVDHVSCSKYDYGSIELSNYKLNIPVEPIMKYVEKKDEQLVRLEMIKQKILKNLNLKDVPLVDEDVSNKISNDHLFDHILEDEQQQEQILQSKMQLEQNSEKFKDSELTNPNQLSSLTNNEPINQVYLFPIKTKLNNKYLFNMTFNSKYNKLGNIEEPKNFILNFRKKSNEKLNTDRCKIIVKKQTNTISKSNQSNLIDIGTLDKIDYNSNNLIKYNLNKLFTNILELKSDSIIQEEQLIRFDVEDCFFDSAMLTIGYESNQKGRSRRAPIDCAPNGQTNGCCREPLYVNFTTIGWTNWILQPEGYNAYYCKGKCDISNSRYYYTTVGYKLPSIITQCCSPRELSAISFIYVDENNFVFKKNIPNMVVESCDCV